MTLLLIRVYVYDLIINTFIIDLQLHLSKWKQKFHLLSILSKFNSPGHACAVWSIKKHEMLKSNQSGAATIKSIFYTFTLFTLGLVSFLSRIHHE